MSTFSFPQEYIHTLRPSMYMLFKYDPMMYLFYYASVTFAEEGTYDMEFLRVEDLHNFCRDILGVTNFMYLEFTDNIIQEMQQLGVKFTIIADTDLNPLVIFPSDDDFVKMKLSLVNFTEMSW